MMMFFFFFSSRRRHTRWPRDWSSDVCSSDLRVDHRVGDYQRQPREEQEGRPLGQPAVDEDEAEGREQKQEANNGTKEGDAAIPVDHQRHLLDPTTRLVTKSAPSVRVAK